MGRRTTFELDALGRLVKTTFPGSPAVFTQAEYDSAGRVSAQIDARNNRTNFGYDSAGHRTSVTNADGKTTLFGFDAVGNLVAETDALGRVTVHFYDSLNRETGVLFADGTSAFTDYDSLGRRTVITDQGGKRTRSEYDRLGRLIAVIDHDNNRTEYGYDEVGNQISQTDAENHVTRFEHDKMGRRTKKILADGRFEAWTYDLAGNQRTHRNLEGFVTTFEFDDLNRMTAVIPDATTAEPRIDYTYYANGQRKTMRDGSGLTEYFYDDRDRLTEARTPNGSLTFSWDVTSNLTGIETNRGTKMTYKYDVLNRLVEVDDPRVGKTTYEWDAVGNLKQVHTPNGVTAEYAHDQLNRVTSLQYTGAGLIERFAYVLGPAGERRSVSELSGRTSTHTFDNLYRITSQQLSNAAISGVASYQYSRTHNRTLRTSTITGIGNQNFTHDQTDQNTAFPHDPDGNIVTIGNRTYDYNSRNQIVKVSGPTGIWLYVYNGDGDMVAKGDGTETMYYLVIPGGVNFTGVSQVVEEVFGTNPQTGTLKKSYTYGLSRISQTEFSGIGNVTVFYGTDAQGTVRFLTDQSATKVAEYQFDAFGISLSATGPAAAGNPYRFHSERWDDDAALVYSRARWYSPELGTWTSRDPFEGILDDPRTLSPYSAYLNSPVDKIDPTGKVTLNEVMVSIQVRGILIAQQFPKLTQAFIFIFDVLTPAEASLATYGTGISFGGAIIFGGYNAISNLPPPTGSIGDKIAQGHAFVKHIIEKTEFVGLDIRTRNQFANFINGIISNTSTVVKKLQFGRTGYWDEATGTVVVVNPTAKDFGTCFRPDDGRKYFDNVLH